jgi:endogenous inhibitor of DNA gyrase (YacG/DUF329 family)
MLDLFYLFCCQRYRYTQMDLISWADRALAVPSDVGV